MDYSKQAMIELAMKISRQDDAAQDDRSVVPPDPDAVRLATLVLAVHPVGRGRL